MRVVVRLEIERDTESELLSELLTACQAVPGAMARVCDTLDQAQSNVTFESEAITGRSFLAGVIEK